jgi:hypothetical protein
MIKECLAVSGALVSKTQKEKKSKELTTMGFFAFAFKCSLIIDQFFFGRNLSSSNKPQTTLAQRFFFHKRMLT